jgi:hypothetical protein
MTRESCLLETVDFLIVVVAVVIELVPISPPASPSTSIQAQGEREVFPLLAC